jgi:integrase
MVERIKFKDSVIAALPFPASGRVEYADTELTGLRLRVTAGKVKTFSLLRRVRQGPMERLTLGRFGDIKTEQARTKAQSLVGRIAEGANPAELKREHKGEPTFAKLFSEYLERHAKPNKRTWREDEQKFRDYLRAPLAKKKISRITRQDLAAIHSKLTADGHPTVANRVKDLVSSVFGKAVSWGYLDANPAKGIADNPEPSRERFLGKGELPRIFTALAREPNTNFRDYFLLALLTGARRANVRAMRWREIDLEQAEWRIPITKNGAPLIVPLVPEAVAILRARHKTTGEGRYVFPADRADSKHGHMSGERKAWLRTLDRDELAQLTQRIVAKAGKREPKAGSIETLAAALDHARATAKRLGVSIDGARLDDVRIHDLRRTLGSWQARTGASLVIIGKSLGHKSQQATAVYARLDTDPVRQAMETATSALLQAAGVKAPAKVQRIGRRAVAR